MWHEAGLSWKDFLPADQDVNKFVTEKVSKTPDPPPRRVFPCIVQSGDLWLQSSPCVPQDVEFTLVQQSEAGGKVGLSPAELRKNLERLLKDKADNQRILNWVEVRGVGRGDCV